MRYEKFNHNTQIGRGPGPGPKPIQNIREAVVSNNNSIHVRWYKGALRAAIYRNAVKVGVIEVTDNDLTEEQVREEIKKEILGGAFDNELTDIYNRKVRERYHRLKAKKEATQNDQSKNTN